MHTLPCSYNLAASFLPPSFHSLRYPRIEEQQKKAKTFFFIPALSHRKLENSALVPFFFLSSSRIVFSSNKKHVLDDSYNVTITAARHGLSWEKLTKTIARALGKGFPCSMGT